MATDVEHAIELIRKLKKERKISDNELSKYIAEIMIRYNLKPRALLGFDAVRAVREGREDG